jgi:hypothetical protein
MGYWSNGVLECSAGILRLAQDDKCIPKIPVLHPSNTPSHIHSIPPWLQPPFINMLDIRIDLLVNGGSFSILEFNSVPCTFYSAQRFDAIVKIPVDPVLIRF